MSNSVLFIYLFLIFNLFIYLFCQIKLIFSNSKMPEQEENHLTPATRLLEKRREMTEVENALSAEKEVRLLIRLLYNMNNFIILL